MSNELIKNIWRFIFLVLLQTLVFKQVSPDGALFYFVSFIIFPLFILLLPFRISHILLICLGFLIGISVDIFYDSWGVHASAAVFTAFIRPYVLKALEPRGEYNVTHIPSKAHLGLQWFLIYSSIMMFAHLFFYFSVEAFTFIHIGQIIAKTGLSFFFSMIFILMYMFIFDPKE